MNITVDDIMERHPCGEYPRSRIEELWQHKNSLTALEISHLDIPDKDILWALFRVAGTVVSRQVANMAADRVVRAYALPESSTHDWAQKWLSGEDRSAEWAAEAAEAAEGRKTERRQQVADFRRLLT